MLGELLEVLSELRAGRVLIIVQLAGCLDPIMLRLVDESFDALPIHTDFVWVVQLGPDLIFR